MEMYGCSLWDLIHDTERIPNKCFSKKCTIQIGIELIKCIREFHNMGFVHLDVKPDNIVVSKEKGNKLYLIDYGISEQFMIGDKHRK